MSKAKGTNKDWPNIGQVPVINPISILQQYVLIDYAPGKSHVVILQGNLHGRRSLKSGKPRPPAMQAIYRVSQKKYTLSN